MGIFREKTESNITKLKGIQISHILDRCFECKNPGRDLLIFSLSHLNQIPISVWDAFSEGHGCLPVLIKAVQAWECHAGSCGWAAGQPSQAGTGAGTELWEQSIPPWEHTFLCKASLAPQAGQGGSCSLGTLLSLVLAPADALRFTIPHPDFHSPGASPACSPSAAHCRVNAKLPSYRHVLRLN